MIEACDSDTLAASCPVAMKSAASPLAKCALVLAAPARKDPARWICRAANRSPVSTPRSRFTTSLRSTASATTRLPRVRSMLMWECFLSVSRPPDRMKVGSPGALRLIHSQAARVAFPVMFCPAASPVV